MSVRDLSERISKKLTPEVLDGILKKGSGLSDVKIEKLEIGAAGKKGDSYLSTVTRFTVLFSGKNKDGQVKKCFLPVIAKALPANVARTKTYRSADFFRNEVIFYEKVWPAYQAFEEYKNLAELSSHIPTCLAWHIDGSNDFIAMTDLSYQNYTNAEKSSGLDLEHTHMILDLFAKFHGLGFAFKDQKPKEFEAAARALEETYFSENQRKWYENFQTNSLIPILKDAVEKELPAEYLAKLNKEIDGDFFGRICKGCEAEHSSLSVVTHGDAWVPNFLIKYDGKKPVDTVMIDFQLTRYASVSNDLLFFLFGCVDFTLLETHWDDLIETYHGKLVETIKKYGSNGDLVSYEDLQKDIKNAVTFGIGMCIEALTMSLLEDDEVADLDAIQGTEAVPIETVWLVYPLKEQAKRKRVASMIKILVDKKLL